MFCIDFASLSKKEILALCHVKLQDDIQPWERRIFSFISNWLNPSVASIQVFTSGSTGSPKSIFHYKKDMQCSAELTCKTLTLQKGNTALLCLPADKISGMMMIVRCLIAKMNMYAIRPSAEPLNSLPGRLKIDFAAFTPMQISGIRNYATVREKFSNINKVILGGEGIQPDLLQILEGFNNQVYATFGMTETISHIALKKVSGINPDKYFYALPGVTVAADKRGCLIISAPLLGQSNLQTNDIVEIISATSFKWLGRIDNVINTGGIKLYAEEIENLLFNFIPFPFFVAAWLDELTGEKPVLCIETDAISSDSESQIAGAIRQLDKISQPKWILLFNKFKWTANGKIKRKETLELPHVLIKSL